MSITETADLLLELMFSWISQREACARELEKMAGELESLREKCTGGETVGSTVSVVGAACLLGAGVATLFTGGAAAPFLALAGGVYTGVGVTVSITSKLIEHFSSSNTMKEAQRKEEESNSIAKKIELRFEQLKKELLKLSPHMGPNDLDQHVMTAFLGAVGRRSGNRRVINFLKDMSFNFGGGKQIDMELQNNGFMHNSGFNLLTLGIAGILTVFAFQLNGKKYKFLFAKAAERLVKMMSSTAFKTALKGSAMVVGGAVGLVFALPEAIKKWKEMIKDNHVTEVSQSLRDTANDILRMTRKLKEQLDDIIKELERLADVKHCIENKQRSPEDKRKLIEYAIEKSKDERVKQWLKEMSRQIVFFGLLDMFGYLTDHLNQTKMVISADSDDSDDSNNSDDSDGYGSSFIDIDIIFVAHGAIEETMISADCLLPLPSIKDVLLYSPWNCLLRADAAYGIATGQIRPWHREFLPSSNRPSKLPNNWNSMRRSRGDMIPVITVSSLTEDDGAWKRFEFLQTTHGKPGRDRVVLPFLFPYHVEVPFYVITLTLSLVLMFSPIKATVHLAACLGNASSSPHPNMRQLMEQYTYTEDETIMTTSQLMLEQRFNNLYRALKAVFDKTSVPR